MKDYWFVKGQFLKARLDPYYELNTEKIIEYLEKYSNLQDSYFWSKLSTAKKVCVCQNFTIKDGNDTKVYSDRDIFIVIGGSAKLVIF